DLGGRCFEQVGRHYGLELVDQPGLDVERLALPHAALDQRVPLLQPEDDLAREHVDGLVLTVVVLETQHVAGLDVEDLAHVAIGPRPDQLVPPRLLDAIWDVAHATPTTGSLRRSDDGVVTHAVTHTPHPTHPSGLSTGCPWSSIASARAPTGQARAHTPHADP